MIGVDIVLLWWTDLLAGSDDEWTTVGPEAEHNWLNVSDLETGSEYEFRVVAMNNGDNKTASEPTVIYVGARKGRCISSSAMILLKLVVFLFSRFCSSICFWSVICARNWHCKLTPEIWHWFMAPVFCSDSGRKLLASKLNMAESNAGDELIKK